MMLHLEVSLAQVLVLLHIEPEVENIFRVFALQEDLFVCQFAAEPTARAADQRRLRRIAAARPRCGPDSQVSSSDTHVETEEVKGRTRSPVQYLLERRQALEIEVSRVALGRLVASYCRCHRRVVVRLVGIVRGVDPQVLLLADGLHRGEEEN